jgi:hypothetical protein
MSLNGIPVKAYDLKRQKRFLLNFTILQSILGYLGACMKRIHTIIVAFFVLDVGFQGCGAKDPSFERQSDSLKPFTQCEYNDGLSVIGVESLPKGVTSREVATEQGLKSVSLSDGYGVLLGYPGNDLFASLNIQGLSPPDIPMTSA